MDAAQLAEVFTEWNRGDLDSYLIEITAEIFRKIDPETGKPLVDMILDKAGQKGTGIWTLQSAIKQSVVISTINAFFFSSRSRHTRFDCDWSSDVCSSD